MSSPSVQTVTRQQLIAVVNLFVEVAEYIHDGLEECDHTAPDYEHQVYRFHRRLNLIPLLVVRQDLILELLRRVEAGTSIGSIVNWLDELDR